MEKGGIKIRDFKELKKKAELRKKYLLQDKFEKKQDSHECHWNPKPPHCSFCQHEKELCIFRPERLKQDIINSQKKKRKQEIIEKIKGGIIKNDD